MSETSVENLCAWPYTTPRVSDSATNIVLRWD